MLIIILILLIPLNIISDTGYNISLSKQILQKQQLDIIANNIANSETIGYQSSNIVYSYRKNKHNSYATINQIYRDHNRGEILETNNPLDLAIRPKGYFKIITPNGIRYTLNGQFLINNIGYLTTQNGYFVCNISGHPILITNFENNIKIGTIQNNITIGRDGSIYAAEYFIDQIGVFDFKEDTQLINEENNLYYSNNKDFLSEENEIISGALIKSNVNSAKSMSDLIELQKYYSMNLSLMSNISDLDKITINKLGNSR